MNHNPSLNREEGSRRLAIPQRRRPAARSDTETISGELSRKRKLYGDAAKLCNEMHEEKERARREWKQKELEAERAKKAFEEAEERLDAMEFIRSGYENDLQGPVIIDENDPRPVIVRSVELLVDGENYDTFDFPDSQEMVDSDFILQIDEGSCYELQFAFHVQRETVRGLQYIHKVTTGAGITFDDNTFIIGTYEPRVEIQEYTSPSEEAPPGMFDGRMYTVHSMIMDDDENVYLDWQWALQIIRE